MNRYARILASCILAGVAIAPAVAQNSNDPRYREEPKRPVELVVQPKRDEGSREAPRNRNEQRDDHLERRRGDANRSENHRRGG